MLQRRPFTSSLVLLLVTTVLTTTNNHVVLAQQRQQQPLQPLGDVLHLIFDKDKNSKVTMLELNSQMTMLESLFQNNNGGEGNDNEQTDEYRRIVKRVHSWAPSIFALLDSNGDDGLTKRELQYATKFEQSLKKKSKEGGMRDLLGSVFDLLDENGDDLLSVTELLEGSASSDVIRKVTIQFHKLFPLRKSSNELEEFVKGTIESIGGNTLDEDSVAKGIAYLDDDGDGSISRKEVGKYYNVAGKKFIEVSKQIKQVGPMMAMFSGMDMGGGEL
mmetsp:Transcript_9404/g.16981  ORF Transcript_9404/g.16981 Transcript_9404/m.16981 type:complete len:274 (-) Transcript_9404:52-873(-)|eukprot:CAMPEP_0201608792 /NCGR_PEP_ID=MMETSP0492-20130828/8911_1 /ASSEMBLY_ACC=CAM_ASM_000837 /TAXON_ID=420259 /ORGANISM="Thalassiosira gravida, Strain GMp14c1" /LENGTH=273 /DNA_ID=CAMNT_0048073767 /DNA_START=86 /DNA_END=907 /DNA_ORIENTATION=+